MRHIIKHGLIVFMMLVGLALPIMAKTELSADDARRAEYLFTIIKCPVCTGQNLAESHVDIAVGLKNIITEKIISGQSDTEIIDYFTTIYGDDIILIPPENEYTFLLWYGPYIILMLGLLVFMGRKYSKLS
jgi:cytochrome c-type biogenesis protein CcmH